jgi:hypothetical protein
MLDDVHRRNVNTLAQASTYSLSRQLSSVPAPFESAQQKSVSLSPNRLLTVNTGTGSSHDAAPLPLPEHILPSDVDTDMGGMTSLNDETPALSASARHRNLRVTPPPGARFLGSPRDASVPTVAHENRSGLSSPAAAAAANNPRIRAATKQRTRQLALRQTLDSLFALATEMQVGFAWWGVCVGMCACV